MRRLPVLPTLIVAGAVAVMTGLGIWQVQRAQWKERLIAEYAAAAAMPALDLDPLLDRRASDLPALSYRRVLVTCRARDVEPRLRGGRSDDGRSGYSYFVPCRPGASGLAGRLVVDAGWTAMPDDDVRLSLDRLVAGRLGAVQRGDPVMLTAAEPAPPLAPSSPPSLEAIPNNHSFYAFQWFFFAAAAATIYWLALRRRLSSGERDPKSAQP